jgi:hypothetical protein
VTALEPHHEDPVAQAIRELGRRSDGPADAVVRAFRRLPPGEGWRRLDAGLDGDLAGSPPALRRLL